MSWSTNYLTKLANTNAVLVEGLPGIGNVGKVAVDFMVDELKAKKVCELFSYSLPHSVFVNENNLVELPLISLYHYKAKNKPDLLFLAGDVQPIDEVSSYTFSESVLDVFQKLKGKHIVTLGGIGLPSPPQEPKVYCTGNSQKFVDSFTKNTNLNTKLFGVVGPIIGVSGLLLGLAQKRNIDAVALLAETYGHPMYLGIKGARELINTLNSKYSLDLDMKKLDAEINEMEEESDKRQAALKKLPSAPSEASYIG